MSQGIVSARIVEASEIRVANLTPTGTNDVPPVGFMNGAIDAAKTDILTNYDLTTKAYVDGQVAGFTAYVDAQVVDVRTNTPAPVNPGDLAIKSYVDAIVTTSSSDTFYVDNVAGDDANDGTVGSPFATLQYAVNLPMSDSIINLVDTGVDYTVADWSALADKDYMRIQTANNWRLGAGVTVLATTVADVAGSTVYLDANPAVARLHYFTSSAPLTDDIIGCEAQIDGQYYEVLQVCNILFYIIVCGVYIRQPSNRYLYHTTTMHDCAAQWQCHGRDSQQLCQHAHHPVAPDDCRDHPSSACTYQHCSGHHTQQHGPHIQKRGAGGHGRWVHVHD